MTRILLALDAAPGARHLLSGARALARAHRADLWVVHVLQPDSASPRAPDLLEQLEEADAWMSRLLRSRNRLERPLVVLGDPAHEIASTARVVGADLIVMGAHPRSEPRHGQDTRARIAELSDRPVLKLPALPSEAE